MFCFQLAQAYINMGLKKHVTIFTYYIYIFKWSNKHEFLGWYYTICNKVVVYNIHQVFNGVTLSINSK